MLREVLRLPYSTAECEQGPIVEHSRGRMTLRYDTEEAGQIVWTVVRFAGVLAVRFTPDPACPPWLIGAYSRVSEVETSEWLRDLSSAATGRGEALTANARHLAIYFDHIGCWEAIAGAVEVGPAAA